MAAYIGDQFSLLMVESSVDYIMAVQTANLSDWLMRYSNPISIVRCGRVAEVFSRYLGIPVAVANHKFSGFKQTDSLLVGQIQGSFPKGKDLSAIELNSLEIIWWIVCLI